MHPNFEVVGVTVHMPPLQYNGAVSLGDFRLRYGCLEISGASLLKKTNGCYALLLPKGGRRCRIFIHSYEERKQVLETVCAAFRAIAAMPLATAPEPSELSFDDHP